MSNIILFLGDFNPIHNGHINMALKASQWLDARVIFVPSKISVWKDESVAHHHKVNMLHLALDRFPQFSIDEWELNQIEEHTYSIDTIRHYKEVYPDDRLHLLIGYDHVQVFDRWKDAEEIAELAQIIFYARNGQEWNSENIEKYHMEGIFGSEYSVSSTDIRALRNADTPLEVLKYIEDNELYSIPLIKDMMKPKRWEHVKSVAHLALEIAQRNHVFAPWKLYVAGIVHDMAKDVDKDEVLERMETEYPQYADMPYPVFHQFIGVDLAREILGIEDEDILSAIWCHTTGKPDMNAYEMILFESDKIEPTRGFDSKDLIDACLNDYKDGFVKTLAANKEFLKQMNSEIDNSLTDECYACYHIE